MDAKNQRRDQRHDEAAVKPTGPAAAPLMAELSPAEIDALWAERRRKMRTVILSILRTARVDAVDMAEELVQDALTKACERAQQFRGDANVDTWLHRIAVNTTVDALRKIRSKVISLEEVSQNELNRATMVPLPGVEFEKSQRVEELVAKFPADAASLARLKIQGLSAERIGEVLGISGDAVRQRWRRCVSQCQKRATAEAKRAERRRSSAAAKPSD